LEVNIGKIKSIIAVGILGKNVEEVKIGGEIYNSSSKIVMSHFKGRENAGFCGVLKNLAMSCVTPTGKQM